MNQSNYDLVVVGADGFLGNAVMSGLPQDWFIETTLVDKAYLDLNEDPIVNPLSPDILRCGTISQVQRAWNNRDTRESNRHKVSGQKKLFIINLAGVSRKGKFEDVPSEVLKFGQNIELIAQICEFIRSLSLTGVYSSVHLMHISTIGIYLDDDPLGYVKSKAAQELLLRGFCSNFTDGTFACQIFRLCDVYGSSEYHQDKVINKILECTKHGREMEFIDKRYLLFPIHVDFVVRVIVKEVQGTLFRDGKVKSLVNHGSVETFLLFPKRCYRILEIVKFAKRCKNNDRLLLVHKIWIKFAASLRMLLSKANQRQKNDAFNCFSVKDEIKGSVLIDNKDFLDFWEEELVSG